MRIKRPPLQVLLALLAALALPSCLHAQRVESIAPGMSGAAPLQILDDSGQPITEWQIRERMKRSKARWLIQPLGILAGALIFYAITPKGPSVDRCSIYDPCSEREEFYRGSAAVAGGITGFIFATALTVGGKDRVRAVEEIRQGRNRSRR